MEIGGDWSDDYYLTFSPLLIEVRGESGKNCTFTLSSEMEVKLTSPLESVEKIAKGGERIEFGEVTVLLDKLFIHKR